jgi:accessory gene regulator B
MERVAELIGRFLAAQLNMDDDRREIVSYGALTFLQNGASLVLMLLLSSLGGVLPYTLAAMITAGLMRHASGGAHLRTPLRCVMATSLAFVACGFGGKALAVLLAIQPVGVRLAVVLAFAGAGLVPVFRYAPVEAETRPLGTVHRVQLRRLSLRLGGLMATGLALGALLGVRWTAPVLIGFLVQSFTLTPAGHKAAYLLDRTLGLPRGEV